MKEGTYWVLSEAPESDWRRIKPEEMRLERQGGISQSIKEEQEPHHSEGRAYTRN